MIPVFPKSSRRAHRGNRRTRNLSDDEPAAAGTNDLEDVDDGGGDLEEIQSSIRLFKEKKDKRAARRAHKESSFKKETPETSKSSSLLSFDDVNEDDEGEVFQVKKSSQSRRLIKQKKAERKKKEKKGRGGAGDGAADVGGEGDENAPRLLKETQQPEVNLIEEGIMFKDTIPKPKASAQQTWTLSGREAEALHLEEEDQDDDDDQQQQSEPLRDILQSGGIPDAAAIHEARKRRQAAREKLDDYIPVQKSVVKGGSRLVREDPRDDDSDEEKRISFTGVKPNSIKQQSDMRNSAYNSEDEDEDEHETKEEDWEQQQIRKAGVQSEFSKLTMHEEVKGNEFRNGSSSMAPLKKPAAYDLHGIKGRLKERLASLQEVHRRHQSDADRAVDDFVHSQSEIDRLQTCVPQLAERHKFYQDLRGYVTDLVECFNEKIGNITYLEDKLNKSKESITQRIMERRREDVRDQMIELSSVKNTAPLSATDAAVSDVAHQRRSAEREGRRRRRQQAREQHLKVKHDDGMSSDDELSTLDQAAVAKTRHEVENQARLTLSDVVEDFSTIAGVKERLEDWKKEDAQSYTDAYVSLCLPKIFSPLVRLQLLFWSPFAENNDIEQMEWFRSLSTFHYEPSETEEILAKDPDRRLVSLVVEKVILPKVTRLVRLAYDPLSTTQTLRLTGLINKFVSEYPTLQGDSKQVRELLEAVRDRLKACIDQDPYIPIGYAKQMSESPNGPHAQFVHRQFWTSFKLMRNSLSWQGLLGDQLLVDYAVSSLLNRYLLTALNLEPDVLAAVFKSRRVASELPASWRQPGGVFKRDLARLAGFLVALAQNGKGLGRDGLQEIANILKYIGYAEEGETIKRLRL